MITFRFVRQTFTASRTTSGDAAWTCNHSAFEVDPAGDWIEKDYGNGNKSYKMAIDCNPKAVTKLRISA